MKYVRGVPPVMYALLLTACEDAAEIHPPKSGDPSEVFREVARIELDESPIAIVGQLLDWLPLDDQILVADGMSDRVLAFTPEGVFKGAVGRRGQGPGEFVRPTSLLEDTDGTILVTESSQRMTRLSPELQLMDVYRLDVPTVVPQLASVRGDVVLFQWDSRSEGDNFVLWNAEEGLGASFDPRSPLVLTVPYWNSAWSTKLAVGENELYIADSMVYPIRRYTLNRVLVDTFGVAPPSWKQASKPEVGQFATSQARESAQDWLRSFTVIDGLHTVGEDWLIVTHRDRTSNYKFEDAFRADVYQLDPIRKVWEDIPLPGPVLRGGECAWVVLAYPPAPWTVACWQPVRPRGAS